MKRISLVICIAALTILSAWAQIPKSFKYQAIVRNSDGTILDFQPVALRISLIAGNENNAPVYIETHSVVTNNQGLVNLNIGQGSIISGDFSEINWGTSVFFIKIEMDPAGGANFKAMGISPLLAVPYAMHAQTVTNNDDADADPVNEIQDLKLVGSTLMITKNTMPTEINLAPYMGTNTDEQVLSFFGDSLAISNGNKVDLTKYLDNTDAQKLSINGTNLTIDGGNTVDLSVIQNGSVDSDTSPTNEIQDLQLSGNLLSITKNSTATPIDLASYKDNTDAQNLSLNGTNLSIQGGNTVDLKILQDGVNDADTDPTNELQSLSVIQDTLYISNGNRVTLPKQDVLWDVNGSSISYTSGNIGIGNSLPNNTSILDLTSNSKGILVPRMTTLQRTSIISPANGLLVFDINYGSFFYYNSLRGKWTLVSTIPVPSTNLNEALFAVVNQLGDTIFAVYPEGVRMNVGNGVAKGTKGGFAVASMGAGTKANKTELLRVTTDSVRIYIDQTTSGKGTKGGFAVASMGAGTKLLNNEYLRITKDSIRMYVENGKSKGTKGGFAVASMGAGTKSTSNFMYLEPDNYLIGQESGANINTGLFNSFLGYQTGYSTTDASNNVFLGYKSGYSNTLGNSNVFIGNTSGYTNTTGNSNVVIGDSAGFNTDAASFNVYIGKSSGLWSTTGERNTFMGYYAGLNNSTGYENVFIGNQCGMDNRAAFQNVFIGNQSGILNRGSSNVFIGNNTGRINKALNNVFIGDSCGASNTYGFSNTFIGKSSGLKNTTGFSNVFMGTSAGYANLDGDANVFIGNQSGKANTIGNNNVFLGADAGLKNTEGNSNVFIGLQSGKSNTIGESNVFLGTMSGYENIDGSVNVFLGDNSGRFNSNGNANVFLGSYSGYKNTTGSNNNFIGSAAGWNNTEGVNNIYLGNAAGFNGTTGSNNVFLGFQTGYNNNGSYNIMLGDAAGYNNTSGQYNIFMGYESGNLNTDGTANTFLGFNAGKNYKTGDYNTFIGYQAGLASAVSFGTGNNNVGLGYQAGSAITSGNSNVFIGNSSGQNNTDGNYNTLLGNQAGKNNTIGDFNVFIGHQSGYNDTASYNTFVGYKSGYTNKTGKWNVLMGYEAGYSNDADYNSFIGYQSGRSITSGHHNSFLGYQTGRYVTRGSYNVFMGYQAGYAQNTTLIDTSDNNVGIGYRAGFNLTKGNDNIIIGREAGLKCTTGSDNTLIGQWAGIDLTTGTNNVAIGYYAGRMMGQNANNALVGKMAGERLTSGDDNTFIGAYAGQVTASGNQNTFLGYDCGRDNNGNNNTFVGYRAGINSAGSNNVFIGNEQGWDEDTNNKLMIDNHWTSTPLIWGDLSSHYLTVHGNLGVNTKTPGYALDVIGRSRFRTGGGSAGFWLSNFANTSDNAFIGMSSDDYVGIFGLTLNSWGFLMNVNNGNIGMGTNTPAYKLDVAGALNLNKGLTGVAMRINSKEILWFDNTYLNFGYEATYANFACPVNIGDAGNHTTYKLYVAGNAYSTGTWGTSDIRWKKNIAPITNVLPKLLQLQGVNYTWRADEFPNMNFDKSLQIGLIAQEVEKYFPELVKTDNDGYKALSYDKISAILIEGMKEQQKQIIQQQSDIEALKTELAAIKEMINK